MSVLGTVYTGAAARAAASGDQSYVWTTVLILGVILACVIGASFYAVAPVLDASLVGP
jgi:hypothetical protein